MGVHKSGRHRFAHREEYQVGFKHEVLLTKE